MKGRIPQSFIDQVLSRVDIVELIDRVVPLKKAGHDFKACCPFHQEKSPSFSVSPTKQVYYCFGCGAGGNAITFLRDYENLPFTDAIEQLAGQAGMEMPEMAKHTKEDDGIIELYKLLEFAREFYKKQLRLAPHAIEYLKKRGLSGQTAQDFHIGYAPNGWDNLMKAAKQAGFNEKQLLATGMITSNDKNRRYDRFRDRVMFPIHDRRGRVLGFGGRIIDEGTPKYLNSPETPVFHKSNTLYGLYEARHKNRKLESLLITEGYMDVVALAEHGVDNAVATLGTATTAQHLQQLLRHVDNIYFSFDGDRAGKDAAWRALEVALPLMTDEANVRFLFLPDGEDPDSFISKHGKEIFLSTIKEQSISIIDFFLDKLSSDNDLSSIDGRARVAKLASKYIEPLPKSYFKQLLLDELGKKTRMDFAGSSKNQTSTTPRISTNNNHRPSGPKQSLQTPQSGVRQAIALLIQNPIIGEIEWDIPLSNNIPGMDLLRELLQTIKEHNNTSVDDASFNPEDFTAHSENSTLSTGGITTGALIEHWRGKPEEKALMKLANIQMPIPEDGVKAEFADTIKHIVGQHREAQIENLMNMAASDQLSDDQKTELEELLKAK